MALIPWITIKSTRLRFGDQELVKNEKGKRENLIWKAYTFFLLELTHYKVV